MNFFSIFVVLVVVVLHNRCVDAQIHDEAYYEERYKERVEWIRYKLKTLTTILILPTLSGYASRKKWQNTTGLTQYHPISKNAAVYLHLRSIRIMAKTWMNMSGRLTVGLFVPHCFLRGSKRGYSPLCYICGPFDHKCWFHLGAMVDESCIV